MELRPKEDNPDEQRQNADALSLGLHVLTKTELRQEWLRGQENDLLLWVPVCNQSGLSSVKGAKVKCRQNVSAGSHFRTNACASRSGAARLRRFALFCCGRLALAPTYEWARYRLPCLPGVAHARAGGRPA